MADNSTDQLREAKDLLEQLNKLKRQLGEQPLRLGEAELLRVVQDLPNEIRRARKELEDIEGTASDLYSRLRGVTSEFKYQATTLGKVRGAFRQLEEAAQNLKHDEQGISDLNTSQLKKLQEKVKKNKELLTQEASSLISSNRLARYLEEHVELKKQAGESEDQINQYILNRLSNIRTLGPEEKSLLQLYFDQKDAVSDINNKVLERIEQEKRTNKLLGVGGAAIGGISSLMSKLGMNSGIFRDAVDEAQEAMRGTAKNIQAGTQSGGRLTVLMAGLGPLAKGFGRALFDPATFILKIVDGFLEVNKAAVEYQRLTGQNAVATAGMNSSLATSVDVLTTMAEITKQTGLSATSIFSPADLGRLAEAKNLLGLSGEQATNLGRRSKLTGQSIESYQDSIVAATNKYNGLNGTAVAHGVVMQDVLNTSDEIALSLGGDAAKISAAATAARGLGLELAKVDQIAGSLLQFEDSIGKELEAELLTGKNINLEKAREFALTGNLAGLSDELKKNGASAAEFAGMNRIEQESLAAALGMSRQELAKTVMTQEASKNLTIDQRAAAIGVSKEQLRSMDIQTEMNKSLEKLAQAFAPILEAMMPIAKTLISVIQPIAAGVASITSGIAPFITSLMIGYGILKGMQVTMLAIQGIQTVITALKGTEVTASAARLAIENSMVGSIMKSIGVATIQLLITEANAAAALTANAAMTFGVGVAVALAAAAAGYAVMKSMKDGEFNSDGKPTLFTSEGAVTLLPNDSVYSAADGSMKVGTDLLGEKARNTVSNTTINTISEVATNNQGSEKTAAILSAKLDTLIAAVKAGGDVYLDSNKVGRAQTLGSYKLA